MSKSSSTTPKNFITAVQELLFDKASWHNGIQTDRHGSVPKKI